MASLTPKGLPYGENAAAAERQAAAGLPQSISASSSPVPMAQPQRSPVRAGSSQRQTDDPLRVLNPAAPLAMAPTPQQQFTQIAERSANPLMRLIAMRLADDQPR